MNPLLKSNQLKTNRDPAFNLHAEEFTSHERRKIAQRYEILSRLGEGGMGEVWHAYDVKLRIDVALKSCSLATSSSQSLEDLIEALRSEVRTAREVLSPNVCRIYDLVVDDNHELISMEFIDGITLMEMLIQKGALDLREARDIAAQFLAGLDAIHHAGLVHRDLKPENIMITRTGRVIVMDFGVAKHIAHADEEISGTIAYMSPEQMAGEKIDARSDVFAAGIVLAEMIHPDGIVTEETRQGILNTLRRDPLQLPDSPWKPVIARAVSLNLQERYPSAGALARALEELTQRIEIPDEFKPYPGLASFGAENSGYFFGRELELELLIKKLQQLHLSALIGPSGAGKTSLLQAGLIPNLPDSWNYILVQPGNSPFLNLAEAIAPKFPDDPELNQFENAEIALTLLGRWRQNYSETLLIVDRFEELFTLNPPEIQARFAELIGRFVLEADVRVLLVMRDDFLIFCKEHPSLAPIFSELTVILPLNGAALRRALVQPALKCGYRFEDEKLVDDILYDLEKERGALPLMAFAASRLWEKRDRESGFLTRRAYQDIGGVSGALAQHAEATIERLGVDKHPIVREIFRNLITAQGTRVARDTKELLSIFQNHKEAEEVLRVLVDARLLTSFEAPRSEGEEPKSRVEIIHESLIKAWPRLVQWEKQDADGAQLRDQLRQASQLWEQRNRSTDLLWTGAAFLEFQVWRQRYPGGLTATEEAFAQAMLHHANKQRKRRQFLLSTTSIVLFIILVIITFLWRQSTAAKNEAVLQANNAQASKVLTAGRALLDADPSTKLAYAIASLEFADSTEARRFALQALATGPPALMKDIPVKPINSMAWSPDGKWMAVGVRGGLQLYPLDGSDPITVSEPYSANHYIPWSAQFSADGKFLIWTIRQDTRIVKVWSMSEKKVIRTFNFEGTTIAVVKGNYAFLITDALGSHDLPVKWSRTVVRKWKFDPAEPEIIGHVQMSEIDPSFDIDDSGRWIAYTKDRNVAVMSLDPSSTEREKIFGPANAQFVKFRPTTQEFASSDRNGFIKIWSLASGTTAPVRSMSANGGGPIWFDPKGAYVFASKDNQLLRWDLSASSDAAPLMFQFPGNPHWVAFDAKHSWIAIDDRSAIAFFNLVQQHPYIYSKDGYDASRDVRFMPDGKSFLNGFHDSSILRWNMPGEKEFPSSLFLNMKKSSVTSIDVDPLGRFLVAGSMWGKVHLLSLDDQKATELGSDGYTQDVAFSKDGKYAAAVLDSALENTGIHVWELGRPDSNILQQSHGKSFYSLEYSTTGNIFAGDFEGNLYRWDSINGPPKILHKGKGIVSGLALSSHNQTVAVSTWSEKTWDKLEFAKSELVLLDLKTGKSVSFTSHGTRVFSVGFDSTGTTIVTGDLDGNVRVGPLSSHATPHLMMGHQTPVNSVIVHPSGKWIASTEGGRPCVRLWPMPHGQPIAGLSHTDFLGYLKRITNVRIVPDKNSSNGYKIQYALFPGLGQAPE
jgi:serine/threonine protein kinase/WD40 repeat protein